MTSSGSRQPAIDSGDVKALKDGERILAPTRRPDGTLRKPIRIRAGYVPQDEVAIYQSKGAIWRKEMEVLQDVPPGYDPVVVEPPKPKSRSAKRNEKKKEKRQQKKDEESKNSDGESEECRKMMDGLRISEVAEEEDGLLVAVDKKIRALKKKIRLAEAQQQPEKMEKVAAWRDELKLLEDNKQQQRNK
ncbi:hypothetical protein M569_06778 [Genlisea aurea]|uniref:WIBG Mago-binding domain-containing protein n=1 Tax=Genlisea aurea TaxID=192259 RepID=S8CLG0_9LAMI|nr:hypothetical protein M569_06778 [Genlisea aurea]